jgi:CRP/FNR family cyclic AMP-dependent transcriptional regulator
LEPNTEAVGQFLQQGPQDAEPRDLLVVPGWGQEEWSTLFSHTQPVKLDVGEVLIQSLGGDRVLYFVVSGRLEVATIDSGGEGISTLATILPGSVVGELAFFDGAPRSAKVWAVMGTHLLKLTLADYDAYASKNASDAAAFLFAMARLLAYRVRHTTKLL